MSDEIVEEIHRIREKILAQYGGDLAALMRDSQRRTEELAKAGRRVVANPPGRPNRVLTTTSKKAS
jgi:hypothetical protein